MFKIIHEFTEDSKNSALLKYTIALSGICGIFLTIPTKSNIGNAEKYIMLIQFFWLVLFSLVLGLLFTKFFKFAVKKEKDILTFYSIPVDYSISLCIGLVLIIVLGSLWLYLLTIYTGIFVSAIIYIILPISIILFSNIFLVKLKKIEIRTPLIILFLINSLIISIFISYLGFILTGAILKIFYLFWFYQFLPITLLSFLLLFVLLAIIRGKNILKHV